jgi:Fe2+ transport system protein FeoA
MKTMADLTTGQKAKIINFTEANPDLSRLMSMGLVQDIEVYCEGVSLGGDPKQFSFYGSHLTARNNTLKKIIIEIIDE